MSGEDFSQLLKRVADGETLDEESSARAFGAIMAGGVGETQMGAFLAALAVRKPKVEEIAGAVKAMRAAMKTVEAPDGALDLVGTGGDGHGTLNISSAACFVAAACGVPIAKHGNRNMSSRTGAADVLEALGVKIDLSPETARLCIEKTGVCFLFAQSFHPAMKHVAPVRRALGFRTIFNLLGPLSNPARVKRQLLGVYALEWMEPVAKVLGTLGAEKAWVVHGNDGLDEMSISDITHVAVLDHGRVDVGAVAPEDAGLPRWPLAAVKGGEAPQNAAALMALLDGELGAYRDIVLLNTAAALIVADKAENLRDGAILAAKAIDDGAAKRVLEKLIVVSNSQ
jgi:anthranilate phosphoribosyltransferase